MSNRVRRAQRVYPVSGLRMSDQLRTLICNRDVLVGYVTLGRSDPFSPHERAFVTRLLPVLRRRLLMNRKVAPSDLLAASLEASLESVGSPAFITNASGHVLHANSAGHARLSADRRGTQELLVAKIRGRLGDDALMTRIVVPGMPEHWLVVLRDGEQQLAGQARRASAHWRLTPRQSEVLSLVVRGLANASIALVLGCAEHTVALHVSAILDRAGVDSRAALAAAVGTLLKESKNRIE